MEEQSIEFHKISAFSGHIEGDEAARNSVAQKVSGRATQVSEVSGRSISRRVANGISGLRRKTHTNGYIDKNC